MPNPQILSDTIESGIGITIKNDNELVLQMKNLTRAEQLSMLASVIEHIVLKLPTHLQSTVKQDLVDYINTIGGNNE